MRVSCIIAAVAFIIAAVGLYRVIGKGACRRHDVLAPEKFDFDAFKSREIARCGFRDATRIGGRR